MDKKYELTSGTQKVKGNILHRIRACRSFGDVREGTYGGCIESEANLSHGGCCWVSSNARVWGDARILGNAEILGAARIYENAWVDENAQIFDRAQVFGNARVFGDSQVFGNAHISGDAWICGRFDVFGEVLLSGDVQLCGIKLSPKNIKLDHGIWNRIVRIDDKWYAVSTTLQKISMV